MRDVIRFRFAPAKAKAAIQLMLERSRRIDLHAMLKACYFADKSHLNKFGRPIFGATYRAMKFGPVPLEIYEMAKGESIWLAELGDEAFPWEMAGGYHIRLIGNEPVKVRVLSKSDVSEINSGFEKSTSMTFNERTAATHGPDWQAADLGIMRYEDMIDESPAKAEIVAYLRQAGPIMKL
jgi:hypothetical protein